MKGRKPLPIELHVLNGNPGKRPLPEPMPVPQGIPDFPPHLPDDCNVIWNWLGEMLQTMGIVSKADALAMEVLCETWLKYRSACQTCDQYGTVLKIGSKLMVSPYFKVRRALVAELHRMFGEFGLTPASRARIVRMGESEPEDDDPLVAMMRARAGNN